jgi:hypothetical protein
LTRNLREPSFSPDAAPSMNRFGRGQHRHPMKKKPSVKKKAAKQARKVAPKRPVMGSNKGG